MTMSPVFRRIASALVIALALTSTAVATTVLPLDLEALTNAADRVFMGRVVAIRTGRDGHGLPVTWTTFTVDEALKGTVPSTIEIKQIGVDAPLADGAIYRIPALPRYRVGDEVILFLHPDSREGFTSPVGLGQGRFRIRREHGASVAENDVGNANLHGSARAAVTRGAATRSGVTGASVATGTSAPIAVDDLITRVRALADAAH